ncbi:MAG TPA: hypothetical protein VHE30_16015 [Polyangiaceae bacterium]|nr:hypothetical protein [Polyangiaceae bacterium]
MNTRTRIAFAVTTGLLGFAHVASAQEEIRTTETRPNQSMLASGVFAFGAPYVASVIVAAESDHPGDHRLYYPVAGPWLDLGDRYCPAGRACSNEGLYKGLLVADGILQGIGAFDLVGAFLFPETVTTRSAASSSPRQTATVRVSPTPMPGGYGLIAAGAF